MKYGIICAMQEEINLLAADIVAEEKVTIAGRDFYLGNLYGADVVLVQSRIGKVAAASTASTIIDRFCVDQVIFCGVAGGADFALDVGDVVIADSLVQHDLFAGPVHFRIPILGIAYIPADKELSDKLQSAVEVYIATDLHKDIPMEHLRKFRITTPKVARGTIASGDQFINDSARTQWLRGQIDNLQCVEMEGAAVAQVCYEYDLPFAVLRVISDSANEDSDVDFDEFVADAASHFTRGCMKAFLSKNPA